MHVALDLVDAVLDRLPALSGPVNVRLPKTVKAPEGAVYAWTENPLGINGYYLVSRGERTPWRLKLRSASFNNVQALKPRCCPATRVEDLTTVLGSLLLRRRRHRPLRPRGAVGAPGPPPSAGARSTARSRSDQRRTLDVG